MWQSFLKSCDSWLKPSQGCLLCHDLTERLHLCTDCLPWLQQLTMPDEVCPLCAHLSTDGAVCGECQQNMPYFDRLWASYRLAFPLHQIITEYKFHKQWSYAPILAAWMQEHPPKWLSDLALDGVVAMPLSRGRLFERGYNQSECLLQFLSTSSLISSRCSEVKISRLYRPPQSSMSHQQRHQNVDGVFSIQNDVNERHLLLIDDVVTTCATLNELARKLKGAGAASVSCWVLARA